MTHADEAEPFGVSQLCAGPLIYDDRARMLYLIFARLAAWLILLAGPPQPWTSKCWRPDMKSPYRAGPLPARGWTGPTVRCLPRWSDCYQTGHGTAG